MLPKVAALVGGDDRLEHRPKDVGVDLAPVERSQSDQPVAGSLGEGRHRLLRAHREQPAVDVREPGQMLGLAARILGVQGREQRRQEVVHVRPVGLGMRADRVGELALGKDPGVLGEEAEQQPCEEHVQPMPAVHPVHQPRVGREQLVEELAHPLGGLDIRVGLSDVLRLLHARPGQEEGEVLVDVPDWDH
jgi:hypothetical protein